MVKPQWRQLDLEELDQRDMEILSLKWSGMKIKDIADQVGLKPITIVQYMSNGRTGRLYKAYREFCRKMADLTKEEAFNKVKQNLNLAVGTLIEETKGTAQSTSMSRIKAAQTLINIVAPELRAGKVEIDNRQVTFKWQDDDTKEEKVKKIGGADAPNSDKIQSSASSAEVAQQQD